MKLIRKSAKKNSAQNSTNRKRLIEQGFKPNNPWRFAKGKSGNPGGRPKLLSDAYREWLASQDDQGVSNAAKVALRLGERTVNEADVSAAKELRQATEGDLIRNLAQMTDAELDAFIAQREGRTVPGVSGEGTTPEPDATTDRGDSPDKPV